MKSAAESVLSILVSVALAVVAGMLGAVWYGARQPQPTEIVVVDMARLVRPIVEDETLNDTERHQRTVELGQAVREAVEAHAARGAIVLDASAVINAPEPRYVKP